MLLVAGYKVQYNEDGTYSLLRVPYLPVETMLPAEKAQLRQEGQAVDLAALMDLKAAVVQDPEGLLDNWQPGADPCSFSKVCPDRYNAPVIGLIRPVLVRHWNWAWT